MSEEMWMGQTPAQLHVESFYDDPYACEEDCNPVPSCCDGAESVGGYISLAGPTTVGNGTETLLPVLG